MMLMRVVGEGAAQGEGCGCMLSLMRGRPGRVKAFEKIHARALFGQGHGKGGVRVRDRLVIHALALFVRSLVPDTFCAECANVLRP